jgi:hypothetical protein
MSGVSLRDAPVGPSFTLALGLEIKDAAKHVPTSRGAAGHGLRPCATALS